MAEMFEWFKPRPMWQENGRDLLVQESQRTFRQPQLLQFESDDFVERFFAKAAVATTPDELPALAEAPGRTLKLFQPAHGRYYLVCSSLCCLQRGFPDRTVQMAAGESVFFVLRRLLNEEEWGWVMTAEGPRWESLAGAGKRVLDGEERLPLFPAPAANGHALFFGYLPVASRENYAVAPTTLPGGEATEDRRLLELDGRFTGQIVWIDQLEDTEAARDLSVYVMLDLVEYLEKTLADVAEATIAGDVDYFAGDATHPAAAALLGWLDDQQLQPDLTLLQALAAVAAQRDTLDGWTEAGVPPAFRGEANGKYDYSLSGVWPLPSPPAKAAALLHFDELVGEALAEADALAETEAEEAKLVEVPKLQQGTEERYVLRCVYERPQCKLQTQWISGRSAEFKLASFFDPEAPVRPVRIALPDLNLSSLRRFGKGVGFIMPASLTDKMEDVAGLELSLLEDAPALSSLGLGYLCTFSIPIITICAFILLLIIAIVLHLVFWWLPFLKICLPYPKPSAG